jgi:hypothetical protein
MDGSLKMGVKILSGKVHHGVDVVPVIRKNVDLVGMLHIGDDGMVH